MRQLRLAILLAMASALGACATSGGTRPQADARPEAPPAAKKVRDQVLSESIAASRVVERDGLTCLQALDAYGNVIEEQCEASNLER